MAVEFEKRNTGKRWIIFLTAIAAAAFYVVFRYGELMIGARGSAPVHLLYAGAERGEIIDRNGRILAIETQIGNIGISPSRVKNPEILAELLSPLLDMSEESIVKRINSAIDFVYIKKNVDQLTTRKIKALISEKKLSGLTADEAPGRIYPEESLAAQIIGFTGDENAGLEGIEFAFDEDLRPSIAPNGEILPGNRVVLTIDANIQYILESITEKALKQNEADAVLLMAMDPRNGDILGAASLPGFNPNKFRESNPELWSFRPAVWAYEPGSVFKVFSIAGILDGGFISAGSSFFCNGAYEHKTAQGENIVIKCLGAHGNVSARDIIRVSCNAGAGYASDRAGINPFYNMIQNMGFGSKTLCGAPGESAGFLRQSVRWSARSKPTIAMGQEIAVSAMQMLKAATSVATDGTLRSPRLVSRIVRKDGSLIREYEPSEPVKIMSAATTREMRSYMRDVTSSFGTGRRAFIEDIPLAVKTGTAQIIDPASGAYSSTDFIASCMAMLPEDNPALVIYIVIFKPKGESYLGGRIAAPYIREAAEELVNYLGIPRGRNEQYSHPPTIKLPPSRVPVIGSTVPSFINLSKKDILPFLLREDLKFEIKGEGWVRGQSPPPGSRLTPETIIYLEFR